MTDPKTLYIFNKLIVPDYDSITLSQFMQPALLQHLNLINILSTLLFPYLYLESSRLLLLTVVVLTTEYDS